MEDIKQIDGEYYQKIDIAEVLSELKNQKNNLERRIKDEDDNINRANNNLVDINAQLIDVTSQIKSLEAVVK